MQHSNLLNSLLGATNAAGSAAGKASASRTRAEASTQFQTAMEQARPEVAARPQEAKRPEPRPQAPRETTPQAKASHHRSDNQRVANTRADHARADHTRTDHTRADKARADSARPDKPEPKCAESTTRAEPSADETELTQGSAAQSSTFGEEVVPGQEQGAAMADDANSSKSSAVESLAAGLFTLDTDLLAGEAQAEQTPVDALLADAAQGDPSQEEISAAMALAMVAQPPVEVDAGDTGQLQVPTDVLEGMEQAIATLAEAVAAADTDADNPAVANPALAVGGALATATPSPAGNTAAPQVLAGANTGQLLADVTLDPALVAAQEAETAGTEVAATTDIPETLLPNTKTAFTKALENSLASLDKPLANEAAKPAATALGPLEALARVAEAQAPGARAFTPQTSLAQGFGHPQWNQALGERVLWLAAQNLSAADIRLDPPELGSLQVRVSVNQEQVSVSFVSPNPQVREALDQQATRLREMFAEQGLNLVNVDVSDRHAREQHANEREGNGKRGAVADDEDLQVIGQSAPQSLRLVDHYA